MNIDDNKHMQWARELTYATSPATKPLIDNDFRAVGRFLTVTESARFRTSRSDGTTSTVGWTRPSRTGPWRRYGPSVPARCTIIPGNGGGSAADAIVKNAFTRSDCIIKTPSNNPFTAVAIARTMCEMAPDHPITKHVTVAYWRGGDEEFERRLYQPHNIEKSWPGVDSLASSTSPATSSRAWS